MKNSKETRLVPSLSSVIAVAVILIAVVIFFLTVVGTSEEAVGAVDESADLDCQALCPVD